MKMTNAEKYLKDGVREELIADLANYIKIHNTDTRSYLDILHAYFDKPIKPTLTEDERVILRNIDSKYEFIGRDDENFLYVRLSADNGKIVERLFGLDSAFPSLFKFIKNGEEYSIQELLGGA